MSAPRELTNAQRDEALRLAVERQLPVVATIWERNRWMVLRSRFIPRDPGGGLLCIEPPLADLPAADDGAAVEVASGTSIGITFRRGHHKCMFETTAIGRQRIALSATQKSDALLIRRPEHVQQLQRRAYLRVPVPDGMTIRVELAEGGWNDRTMDTALDSQHCGVLADLSAGGIRIKVSQSRESPAVGRTFAVEFKAENAVIRVDALYRHCQAEPDGQISWGLQLIGLESASRSRTLEQITRLVTHFERLQNRPHDMKT